ncbi:hypothetical protein SAMN05428970_3302 [Agromyces sp. CF514]|uniref:DUF7657 domain-containing protein n=1 Tax=Agromyces sp. CF514 TaxID=1881031 RepID=UPI0008DEBBF2|nr:hypothetical protein [Agromyces sp. CF514]SFR86423.1 hypothetical protein SAMN05428970_3302 [Agromyces sp. CF514]
MTEGTVVGRLRRIWSAWVERYRDFTVPRADGLPNRRVLLAGPALVLVFGVLAVGLAINGTSSGMFHPELSTSKDPDLIAGSPAAIRTDEWNVQTVWAIAQVEQGLPVINESMVGGMDATLPQDLPRVDWSVAFRPHLLGFPVMDLDHAVALKWWLPALGLIAALYCFAVTVLPRRPITAILLATGFYFSPFFQWWFLQTTLWPVAWALVVLTALIWCLRSSTRIAPIVWCAIVGYLTVVMAMGIYVPYIVPAALVVAGVGIGIVARAAGDGMRWADVARRVSGILIAGVVGAAVVGLWLFLKRDTVAAFLGTAYPGERLYPTGQSDLTYLAQTVSSSFALALKSGGWLGLNSSEASTFLLAGAFLIPVVVWLVIRRVRARGPVPWAMVGASAVILLLIAFLYVPGWDAVAHLLFLDRTLPPRLRAGMGLASIIIVVLLLAELSERMRPGRVLVGAVAGLFLASQIAIAIAVLIGGGPDTLATARYWWILAPLSALALYLLGRAHGTAGVALLLVVGFITSATVNPVYRGVLDLRETDASAAIRAYDAEVPGARWVGVGEGITTAMLLESGVQGFNGFQGAPSRDLWSEVDPSGQYEFNWNRLAGVSWKPGEGEPVVANPYPDQILSTFDACSAFAQESVDFVLSDESVWLRSDCLTKEQTFTGGKADSLTIWRVVPTN